MPHPSLQHAIQSIKVGDNDQGRTLLMQVVRAEPQNEQAWLWLSAALSDPQQQRDCLQRVLQINPANQQAARGLAILDSTMSSTLPASPEPTPVSHEPVPALPPAEPESVPAPLDPAPPPVAVPAPAPAPPEPAPSPVAMPTPAPAAFALPGEEARDKPAPAQDLPDRPAARLPRQAQTRSMPRGGCLPLRRAGITLFIIGAGSFILPLFGLQFTLISAFGPAMQGAGGIGLALLGLLLIAANEMSGRLSPRTLMLTAGGLMGSGLVCMLLFVIVGALNMQGDVGELTTYTYKTGLFSMAVPSAWEHEDSSSTSAVRVDWRQIEGGDGMITVDIFDVDPGASAADLTDWLIYHINERHGTAPGFLMDEPVMHADGRIEVGFDYGRMRGQSIIEQHGSTLSIVTISFRSHSQANLAEQRAAMFQSYSVNPAAPMP